MPEKAEGTEDVGENHRLCRLGSKDELKGERKVDS